MITSDNLASVLQALGGPVVVLVAIVIFREPIRQLLGRIRLEIPGPGGTRFVVAFGQASIDREQPSAERESKPVTEAEPPKGIKWSKSGDLFWLGHDLMWAIDLLLRGAPKDQVVSRLESSREHAKRLGFDGTSIYTALAELKDKAAGTLEPDWTQPLRISYVSEIGRLRRAIGDLANANQPDYGK